MRSRENEKSSSHGEFELSEAQSKEPEIIREISKWVGRECNSDGLLNSAIMGDGLLVKTKNRSEMVVLKSILCFGLRYTVFLFKLVRRFRITEWSSY